VVQAVVFDLWQTLAVWPDDESHDLRRRWSDRLGITVEELDEHWHGTERYRRRETGPIADAIEALHDAIAAEVDIEEVLAWRLELTRSALVPTAGVVATLAELRRRAISTGLISNCTEEVALVWEETPFAELFDSAVFSAIAGCMKPDRAIYELSCSGLDVDPTECLFVGDGANDELQGAQAVGMTPVLFHREGQDLRWDGLRDWPGLRITAIPQVLDLVP
jgi:putative hydrolase of the HAD superfamily